MIGSSIQGIKTVRHPVSDLATAVLFSRLGKPYVGSPEAFSFNVRRSARSGRSRSRRAPGRPRNACQAAHVTVARSRTRTAARFPTQITMRRFL
jgi:hypothetical protein